MTDSNKLTLHDGTVIWMTVLNQSRTYEGLIEGAPTAQMNSSIMAAALSSAQASWKDAAQLIKPKEIPISLSRPYPFGKPARIPGVQCVSRWCSQFESRGELDGSAECTIVWYQTHFALPIDEAVVAQIQKLDWQTVSTFHEW